MYQRHPPPFLSSWIYIVMDICFAVFTALFIFGQHSDSLNWLVYLKAIPIYILIAQLFALRQLHKHVKTVIFGLFCGSLGDWLLLWGDQQIMFSLGGFSFLVGHVAYTTAFIFIAVAALGKRQDLNRILNNYPLFVFIWLLLMSLSLVSISRVISSLIGTKDENLQYMAAIYAAVLSLLTMGGFFIFFVSFSTYMKKAGILCMGGSLLFFMSDHCLAHGKFDSWYNQKIGVSANQYIVMLTYEMAQFMITKGIIFAALHFNRQKIKNEHQSRMEEQWTINRDNQS